MVSETISTFRKVPWHSFEWKTYYIYPVSRVESASSMAQFKTLLKNDQLITLVLLSFQAETEELARKVEQLTAENTSLRSEINKLTESSQKLRMENSALMVLHLPTA